MTFHAKDITSICEAIFTQPDAPYESVNDDNSLMVTLGTASAANFSKLAQEAGMVTRVDSDNVVQVYTDKDTANDTQIQLRAIADAQEVDAQIKPVHLTGWEAEPGAQA